MTNTRNTTQVLQQIYLRISLASWVGYTLRTIPKGRALWMKPTIKRKSAYTFLQEVSAPCGHIHKKLTQVYLRMQIRDTLRTTEQQTKGNT